MALFEKELLLWATLRRFEGQALALYEQHVPAMATPARRGFVAEIAGLIAPRDPLPGSPLEAPVAAVLEAAHGDTPEKVLLVHGLFLEPLGQILYRAAIEHPLTRDSSRELALRGREASLEASRRIPALIRERVGEGQALWRRLAAHLGPVITHLDGLGDAIDALYAETYGLRFADVVADLAGALLDTCVSLGVPRRQALVFLTDRLVTGP